MGFSISFNGFLHLLQWVSPSPSMGFSISFNGFLHLLQWVSPMGFAISFNGFLSAFSPRLPAHPSHPTPGDGLAYHQPITLLQALVGFEIPLVHLDGHVVNITRAQVTSHGESMIIPGEGMPVRDHPGLRGELTVTFSVLFPRALTVEQQSEFKRLLANVQ
ncbi:hypothetical protein PAPYR_5241 [Paratrimastix pyriformis]|uniref:Chaperone DnaJ C-terminal domain-containing protein n=1 Tax=Paratrimastix pyriformis TaxID=342808 RepID=A0ABQ8UQG5_9EUKA|nr:hypothetical protein PAPYR_5241 [Paratrimastix pyriformis]